MHEMKFNVGDRIVTVINGELRKGVIKELYQVSPPVVVVRLEDGSLAKVLYNDIAPEPQAEDNQGENKPIEKPEITITPDEFKKIAARVIVEETEDHPIAGLAFAVMVRKIYNALFVDESEND